MIPAANIVARIRLRFQCLRLRLIIKPFDRPQTRSLVMNLSCKLFVATFAVSAVAGSAALAPLAAAPITLLDGLRKTPAADVQTVQGTPQGTQQLGPDYGNIGPRGGSQPSGN